jgi:cell division septation protein DedD
MSMAEDTRRADEHERQREPGSDPLAELARLIGQSDPFAELKRKPAADAPPDWLARGAAHDAYRAAEPAFDGRPRADEASYHANAHASGPEPAHAPNAHHDAEAYDDRYRVAMPSAEVHPDYYADDLPEGEESYDAAPPPRRPGWIIPVAAVLGLAVVGTAGAFGYRALTANSGPSAPPVIKADTTPPKVAPAQPADAQPKPIYDRVGETNPAQSERMVSREEQPVDVRSPPRAVPPPSNIAPVTAAPPITATPPAPSASEPKRVKTTIIRPGQTDPAQPGAPVAAAPARPAPTKSGPLALNPQSAEAPAAPMRTVRTAPVASTDGSYVVQVSAQKTESDAQASYRALQAKYPGVLSGREASIRRADLGDKGVYYRAQVGPFATANQANTFCDNLKAAGGQCIVQRN